MQKDDVAQIAAGQDLAEVEALIFRSMHKDFKRRYHLTENHDDQ